MENNCFFIEIFYFRVQASDAYFFEQFCMANTPNPLATKSKLMIEKTNIEKLSLNDDNEELTVCLIFM